MELPYQRYAETFAFCRCTKNVSCRNRRQDRILCPAGEKKSAWKYAYTSFQQNTVDQIRDTIAELGFITVGIESSYSATLRGLYLTGMVDDVVASNETWSVVLISTNSYTIFQMEGENLVNYNDIPLAIKSFSVEEAYQTIAQGVSQVLSNYINSKIFVVSQADEISAEFLKKQMQFDKDITVIESNKYATGPLMSVLSTKYSGEENYLTLSAVGAASGKSSFGLSLNVLQDDPSIKSDVYVIPLSAGKEYEISGAVIDALSIIISVLIGIIGCTIVSIIFFCYQINSSKVQELGTKISDIDAKIVELSKKEEPKEEIQIDINTIIDEIAEANVSAVSFYDSISTDIPKNVWLTKYYNKAGREIAVRGIAESIIDIYEYYKNLRIVSPHSDIKLTELKVVTNGNQSDGESKFINDLNIDQDKDRLYSFEISNTQINMPSAEENQNSSGEVDLLKRPDKVVVEETSKQMKPAK